MAMNFTSDNAYGVAPEILSALAAVNSGAAAPYGEDEITARLNRRFADLFEREVAVFPVFTGTAANALAVATLSPPYGAVFCHEQSHLMVDECAAPEFFSGGAKLVPLRGQDGKITAAAVEDALPHYRGGVHSPKPSVISVTQATERGTVYRPDEIAALSDAAHREGMALHVDGARFANAVAHLDCAPADVTWKAGVDVLSFGATKNGALCAEAVVFFDRGRAHEFEYRRKRAGQLASKMRFISVQLEAYLRDGLWLNSARAANSMAQQLARGLAALPGTQIAHAVEANGVFAYVPIALVEKLRAADVSFYEWEAPRNERVLLRFVLSRFTPQEDVSRLVSLMRE
jgi:threonine aldolase